MEAHLSMKMRQIFEALFPFHRSSYEARFVCWVQF